MLTPEEKVEAQKPNKWGIYWFVTLLEIEPSFKEKAVDVAVEALNRGAEFPTGYLATMTGENYKGIVKELYGKIGILNFIKAIYDSWGSEEVKVALKQADVDLSTINYEELYGKVPNRFFRDLGQVKILYEKSPKSFIEDLLNARSTLQQSSCLSLIKEYGIKEFICILDSISGNYEYEKYATFADTMVDFFEKTDLDLDLTVIEYTSLLKFFRNANKTEGKPHQFYLKLVNSIPEDTLEHFDGLGSPLIQLKVELKKNPEKVLKAFLNNKKLPSWLKPEYFKLFDKIPPRMLREFAGKATAEKMEDLSPLYTYMVVNLYPDDYLQTHHTWAFKGATPERKKHFIYVVGVENFSDEQLKHLGIKRARFERSDAPPDLRQSIVEDKVELLRLLLPLAKEKAKVKSEMITEFMRVLASKEDEIDSNTEEKSKRVIEKVLKIPDIDWEDAAHLALPLIEKLKDTKENQDFLLDMLNEYMVDNEDDAYLTKLKDVMVKKLDQKHLIEKINLALSDKDISKDDLKCFIFLEPDNYKKISVKHGWQLKKLKFVLKLSILKTVMLECIDSSFDSLDELEHTVAYIIESSGVGKEADIVKIVEHILDFNNDLIKATTPFLLNLRNLRSTKDNDISIEKIIKKVKPKIKEIFKDDDENYDFLKNILYKKDLFNEFLPILDIHYRLSIPMWKAASKENQNLDLFYRGFKEGIGEESEGYGFLILEMLDGAKDLDSFTKKVFDLVKTTPDVKLPWITRDDDEEDPIEHEWSKLRGTVLWDFVLPRFGFDETDDFVNFFDSLEKEEQKKVYPVYAAKYPYKISKALDADLQEDFDAFIIKDAVEKIATKPSQSGNLFKFVYSRHAKEVYEKSDLTNFLTNVYSNCKRFFNTLSMRNILSDVGFDIDNINYKKLFEDNPTLDHGILDALDQYEVLAEMFPSEFFNYIDEGTNIAGGMLFTLKSLTSEQMYQLLSVQIDPAKRWHKLQTADILDPDFYKYLSDKDPTMFIAMLEYNPSKATTMFGAFSVKETIKKLETLSDNRDMFYKTLFSLKDYFRDQEAELNLEEFKILLNLYKSTLGTTEGTSFYVELINSLPDDVLVNLDDATLMQFLPLGLKAQLAKNPKKVLNLLVSNGLPAGLSYTGYYKLFENVDPSLLKEFCIKVKNKHDNSMVYSLAKYLIVNVLPDNALIFSFTNEFVDATTEQKRRFVNAVGIENFSENDLKKLKYKKAVFEREDSTPSLNQDIIEDKVELLRLLLPLARARK